MMLEVSTEVNHDVCSNSRELWGEGLLGYKLYIVFWSGCRIGENSSMYTLMCTFQVYLFRQIKCFFKIKIADSVSLIHIGLFKLSLL